jgi:hypothetical protein
MSSLYPSDQEPLAATPESSMLGTNQRNSAVSGGLGLEVFGGPVADDTGAGRGDGEGGDGEEGAERPASSAHQAGTVSTPCLRSICRKIPAGMPSRVPVRAGMTCAAHSPVLIAKTEPTRRPYRRSVSVTCSNDAARRPDQ